ncbi:uncharacterized protein RHOBADRAFT_33948 [Rhodotorula graminis WP1]|uniref:Amino acid transporter transmembrane domain-containing protein n=1 Tax=Rhodotorula graminis (strain WP1) TaxID=578459 RepID=A0A194SAX8_RHOGW|nr:uncharacterized protein RHOBADRAFT_33948 [Rhodotorula graminis WP1]KPV77762.1 hypothetical protein RHOBADRAFT_33948 [Rhodotorula graminis WP1]
MAAGKRDDAVVHTGFEGRVDEEHQGEEVVDGVFGEQGKGTVDYRSVGWVSTSVLLMKSQIGLGVLAIPSVFHSLGLIPGIICLIVIGALTTWTDFYIGMFKLKHPTVYSVADCGLIMFGPVGREVLGVGYWLLMTCIAGSALLGISTALNAMSLHATCTAVFVAVAAVVTLPLASMRTMGDIRWIGWVGLVSMIVSIMLVTIAVAVGGRPSLAPQTGPWDKDLVLFGNPSFAEAMNAISNLVFSYAGTSAFLPIASEMRNQRDYPKAVVLCQSFVTIFYLVVGIVVYFYAGQYVASPALGTAGVLIKRVAYGLALPGLFAAAIIYSHLPAKWIFVRILRGSRHLTHPTKTHWIVWLSCTLGCVLFSYVIASAIPVFGGLVGLVGALFGTLVTLQAEACMWFYDNWRTQKRTMSFWLLVALNAFIFWAGNFIMVGGTYGSIVSIKDDYAANGGRPWTCVDNSGSV